MFLRLFIYLYFPLFSIGLLMSEQSGNQFYKGIVFILASIYIISRFFNALICSNFKKHQKRFYFGIFILYSYVILYSLLYFVRNSGGNSIKIITTTPLLLVHVLFWHLVYTSRIYKGKIEKFFKDLFLSVFIGFLFQFIQTLYYEGFSLKPGSVHNLAEEMGGLSSDLNVPLLALLILSLFISWITSINKKSLTFSLFSGYFIIIMGFLALFTLWLYSRRGPLIAFFLILLLSIVPSRILKKLIVLFLIIPLLPLLWGYVSKLFIFITQNDVVNTFVQRNRFEDYLTATNRLTDWVRGFQYMLDFNYQHLIGYGGTPWYLILAGRTHPHNMILSVFFDAGLITLSLVFVLLFVIFRNFILFIDKSNEKIIIINTLFLFWCSFLFLSPIESLLRSYSVSHLIFLMMNLSTLKFFAEIKKNDFEKKKNNYNLIYS